MFLTEGNITLRAKPPELRGAVRLRRPDGEFHPFYTRYHWRNTMDRTQVQNRVINVISRVLKTNPKDITPKSNFVFDLGADSMQSIALIAGFEDEFNIEMEEDKAREVQTVEGAVDFIAQYLK